MVRGLYGAGSGMLSRSRAMDTVANNISNASTGGFKKDGVTIGAFGEEMTYRMGRETAAIGGTVSGTAIESRFTDYSYGPVQETGRSLDLAIMGDGFFTVSGADEGAQFFTRAGRFVIDGEGYLSDGAGNRVMGQDGPLWLGSSDLTVTRGGAVYADGAYVDTLYITAPDPLSLVKAGDNLYVGDANAAPFEGEVAQGFLEGSNVDVMAEMSGLIESTRAFQSCSRMVQMMDRILEKTVNEVGRV